MHNCMTDPAKAPLIARESLRKVGKAKHTLFKTVRPEEPSAPRTLHYQLLPPVTARRHIRPRVKLSKQALFSKSHTRLRRERYKPLPEGWEWPPLPYVADLPVVTLQRKKKKRIPQEVLDEWKSAKLNRSKRGPPLPFTSYGPLSLTNNPLDPLFPAASAPETYLCLGKYYPTGTPVPTSVAQPAPDTPVASAALLNDTTDPMDLQEASSDNDSAAGEVAPDGFFQALDDN